MICLTFYCCLIFCYLNQHVATTQPIFQKGSKKKETQGPISSRNLVHQCPCIDCSVDRPITTPTLVVSLHFGTHSFIALTRISFRDFPLLYQMKGGSLYISLSRG